MRWSVPGEPRRLKLEAINSTSVLVEWRPPAEARRRGVIRGYQVVYAPATNRSSTLLSTTAPAAHVLDVADPSTWQAAVTGLLASTMYQFQVAAVGRKGVGERSRPRRVVTKGQGLHPLHLVCSLHSCHCADKLMFVLPVYCTTGTDSGGYIWQGKQSVNGRRCSSL